MLFEIKKNGTIEAHRSAWIPPKELELEKYMISTSDSDVPILEPSIFGEPLLLISNQVKTRSKKRADILGLDRGGNGVIIELKRDAGVLGVETQALQYLADFSTAKGINFVERFARYTNNLEENILAFVGGGARLEDINKNSRIVLLARGFDPTIFSMGEWLSTHGVAFRCIEYAPVEIEGRHFLSFSVAFDRSPEPLFPVIFSSAAREPGVFWHNIAQADDDWWKFLVSEGQIPACFKNEPGDQGEKILTSYITGDTIVAYAKGCGAVGWGMVERPNTYKLLKPGDKADKRSGECLHRLSISWKATAPKLRDGIPPDKVRSDYGIYHPISTSVSIDATKAKGLLARLSAMFNPEG